MTHSFPLASLFLVALTFFVPVDSPAAERDFVKMIHKDSAGVLVIKDWGKLVKLDDRSPIGKLINNPAIKLTTLGLILQSIPSPADIEKAIGLDEAAALRLIKGKATVSLKIIAEVPKGPGDAKVDSEEPSVEALAFLEFAGNPAEHEKILKGMKQLAQDRDTLFDYASEAFEGALMTTITIKDEDDGEDTYYEALVDGTIVIAENKESLRDGINAIRAGVIDDNFASNPAYLQAAAEMGTQDGFVIFNLEAVGDKIRRLTEYALRTEVSRNPQAALFVDPKTVMDAINLEDFRILYGSFKLEEKRATFNYGLTWKDKVGLTSLIQFGSTPVTMPEFVTTEFKGASIYSLDPAKSWGAIRTLLQKLSPGGWTMVTGMMAATDPKLMPTLETIYQDLIANLEPEIVDLLGFPNRQPNDDTIPSAITIFKVKNPDSVTKTIEAAISLFDKHNRLPKPVQRDYLGSTIFTYKGINNAFGINITSDTDEDEDEIEDPTATPKSNGGDVSYALVGNRLILAVGEAGFIETVIANFHTPGRPLEKSGVFDEIGAVQGIPAGMGYLDVATYIRLAINEAVQTADDNKDEDDLLSKDNLLKQREALKDMHFHFASKTFIAENGIHIKALIVENKE